MDDPITTVDNGKGVVDTRFAEGNPGRPKGSTNHLTKTVKETVLAVFNSIQGDPKANLEAFAKRYPRDFYAIAARLIPLEVKAAVEVIKVTEIKLVRADGNINKADPVNQHSDENN